MIETQVSESGLMTVALERIPSDDEDLAATTAELLEAIDELSRGWIEPIGVGVQVACCDPGDFLQASSTAKPAQAHWLLRVADVPGDVRVAEVFSASREQIVPRLDRATLAHWISEATAQRCEPPLVTALAEMRWTSTRARIPIDQPFVVKDGPLELRARIEDRAGARWALGPDRARLPAPVTLRASLELGAPRLVLTIHWDLWVDRPALVDAAVARVLARPGWARG